MIGYQYPISRHDLCGLDILEKTVLELQSDSEDITISKIGAILFTNAKNLQVNLDVANLCEFARRVAAELLSEEIRKRYGNNCWLIRPRDNMELTFKNDYNNALRSETMAPSIRDAAMVLYFCVPLKMDIKYAALANKLIDHIFNNDLWSYLETERIYFSKPITHTGNT